MAAVRDVWNQLDAQISRVMLRRKDRIDISLAEYEHLLHDLSSAQTSPSILQRVRNWVRDPIVGQLERLGQRARGLAERTNKPALQVVVQADPVFLDPKPWRPFWQAMVHVVRNAIDHGIETTEERGASRKPARRPSPCGPTRRKTTPWC